MKRKGKKAKKIESGFRWIVIGSLVLISALTLTVYNMRIDTQAGETAEAIEQELKQKIQKNTAAGDYTRIDTTDQLLYVEASEKDMPVIDVDGQDYIGILEIPVLDLSLPVTSDWSYSEMKLAPCCYKGSAYRNNMAIAAYNYQSHFGHLNELQSGDTVIFTDTEGNMFCYEVMDLEAQESASLEKLEDSEYDLTLYACNYSGKTRCTVNCSLVNIYTKGVQ
jgi:sortase A